MMDAIDVFNYSNSTICASGQHTHYEFKPARNGSPSVKSLPMSEIKHIHAESNLFLHGHLTFDEKQKAQIFKELRETEWKEILTDDEIKHALTVGTEGALAIWKRIIAIDHSTYYNRVRNLLRTLQNDGVGISARVVDMVSIRYEELLQRQYTSKIILVPRADGSQVQHDSGAEIEKMKTENQELRDSLNEMKNMMEKFMELQGKADAESSK